jgi:hypothetical protein
VPADGDGFSLWLLGTHLGVYAHKEAYALNAPKCDLRLMGTPMLQKRMNYPTGLISNDYWASPDPPYVGDGWSITLRERLDPRAAEIRKRYKARRLPKKLRSTMTIGRELIIQAPSEERAYHAALMLHAAYCLIDGMLVLLFPGMDIRREAPSDAEELIKRELRESYRPTYAEHILLKKDRGCLLSLVGFTTAARIAAVASRTNGHEYALFKYYLSVYLVSVDSIDLNARFGRHDIKTSPLVLDHVWLAQSVALAHGVIEELGLNVRASSQRPSTIEGQWNPDVKSDLVARLKRAGIQDAESQITLCFRGEVTGLERDKAPRRAEPSRWASKTRGNRDQEVPLIDAINWLSRLRSDVSAHTLAKSAAQLTLVDVFNAQTIARRVLLGALGFWDENNHRIIP